MIEELVGRVGTAAGIDGALAEKAVGMIFGFLKKEAPAESYATLTAALPGVETLAAASAGGGGMMGSVMGMMGGGGVMGLGAQMMASGLSMGQIQSISREVFAFGREKAGEDAMGEIVGAIPGLSQFV